MKKIDEEKIFKLAQRLAETKQEADKVNIANLSKEDFHRFINQADAMDELINFILGTEENENQEF